MFPIVRDDRNRNTIFRMKHKRIGEFQNNNQTKKKEKKKDDKIHLKPKNKMLFFLFLFSNLKKKQELKSAKNKKV
jgi:hypothetical protein